MYSYGYKNSFKSIDSLPQALFSDTFGGDRIDPARWDLVNPDANKVLISQDNKLDIDWLIASGSGGVTTNYLSTLGRFTTTLGGDIRVLTFDVQKPTQDSISNLVAGFRKDPTSLSDRIDFTISNSVSSIGINCVNVNGGAVAKLTEVLLDISTFKTVKIIVTATTIEWKYWNGTAWVLLTSSVFSVSGDWIVDFGVSSSSGSPIESGFIDNVYVTDYDFDSLRPRAAAPTKLSLAATDINIGFDGNSLTEGINNAGIDQYFPKEIQTWLSTRALTTTFNSDGISAQKLPTMIANAAANIDPWVNLSKINVLVVNEDVNSMWADNLTGAQNYANMTTYVNARYAAGWDYIIVWSTWNPRLPYDLYTPTAFNLQATVDYNNLLAIDSLGDVYIDMRTAPNIGGALLQAQGAYFADYLHLEAIGYDVVADEIQTKGILNIFNL